MALLDPALQAAPKGQALDRKSLRLVTDRSAEWSELGPSEEDVVGVGRSFGHGFGHGRMTPMRRLP